MIKHSSKSDSLPRIIESICHVPELVMPSAGISLPSVRISQMIDTLNGRGGAF